MRRASMWLWRGLIGLALLLGLAAAPAVLADTPPTAQISMFAPGMMSGVKVVVQRQVGGGWVTVPDWQGTLDSMSSTGVPYQAFTVYPADYSQGPYRWAIYDMLGQNIVATSDPFILPDEGGINLSEVVGPPTTDVGIPVMGTVLPMTFPAPAAQAPLLAVTNSSSSSTACNKGDCAFAQVSAYITGLPTNSWIAIEWQDPQGYWRTVADWEGPPYLALPPLNLMYDSRTLASNAYGQGPFRWAVYKSQYGGVLGVSPSFNLPAGDRINMTQYLSP